MSLPVWKLALLERKKKQEEEVKIKRSNAEEAKLASLPAWKRAIALREKQAKGPTASNLPITKNKISSDKWQVAVERVKGSDSPILNQKSKSKDASSSPRPVLSSATTKTDNKKQVMQKWKHSSSSSAAKPAITPIASFATASSAATPPSPSQEDEDPSLAALPAWKRALILKKRQQQQKPVTTEDVNIVNKQNSGEDEPDSGAPTSCNGTLSAPKAQQPEVVNRRDAEEAPAHRLVEQEGKTLHAPVYKEVDEWANVREQDDKFQGLPLWKQALIKRRRADIAKRSGLPVPEQSPPTSKADIAKLPVPEKSAPPTSKANTYSPLSKKAALEQRNKTTSISPRKVKTVNEQKKKVGVRELSSNRKILTKAVDLKLVSKEPVTAKSKDFKPARKAPLPPSVKDPMFTYNFSKSTRHTLDTGGTSSDSTDSELEDAVVTNLDESSDEGDSGIVLQSYSANKPSGSSPSLGQKSHSESSVSTEPVLGKKRKLRRVSWSDTQLVLEHFYPKYDYSDYYEIEQGRSKDASTPPSTENSGLSHRLHPSLRPNNESDPYAYGFSSAASPRSPTSDNSLSTFVPKALSAYSQSPQILSSYSDRDQVVVNDKSRRLEEVTAEEETDDFYADLTSNTAALLW